MLLWVRLVCMVLHVEPYKLAPRLAVLDLKFLHTFEIRNIEAFVTSFPRL